MDVDKLAKPKDKLVKSKDKTTKPKDNASETVATLSLNVYTETFSRSQISTDELGGRQVGHTWIALKFKDRKSALRTFNLENPTRTLVEKEGGTSMGFWPLKYREEAFRQGRRQHPFTTDRERNAGYTPGAGASQDRSHDGYDLTKSVPGRVEEPDRAYQNKVKISKSYDLTPDQVKSMLGYVNSSRNKDYNLYRYNCTTFAVDAVKAAGQTAPGGSLLSVCFPNALYKELYRNRKNDARISVTPLKPSYHDVTGRDIDVIHDHADETKKE